MPFEDNGNCAGRDLGLRQIVKYPLTMRHCLEHVAFGVSAEARMFYLLGERGT